MASHHCVRCAVTEQENERDRNSSSAGIQHTVVSNQSTINIPQHFSVTQLHRSAPSLVAHAPLVPNLGALYQAIPYMPVHTNINPLVCCCFVYKCGPVASLNGQQLVFV